MVRPYDNPYWEYHLPVNPPGAYRTKGDIVLDSVEIANWYENDVYVFRPRLRDNVQQVNRIKMRLTTADEAPELDEEYDCD